MVPAPGIIGRMKKELHLRQVYPGMLQVLQGEGLNFPSGAGGGGDEEE